jgi:protein-L-isoaspartate(D-aspartate) O-methyltransferase
MQLNSRLEPWSAIWQYRPMRKLLLPVLTLFLFAAPACAEEDLYARERARMIETIRAYAKMDLGYVGEKGISEKVLAAMAKTKRHLFVPERFRSLAYADRPAPIDHGHTISQPFIVALMTHLADVEEGDTALEIGTGSGYQAAILARLVKHVCTIEIVRPLGVAAANRLHELGYGNVRVKVGDGYKGWPDCGPFDAIVVTAALGHIPPPLIEQLKVGGKLVMPVGLAGAAQKLTVLEKTAPGETRKRTIGPVRFVPFIRKKE